MLRKVYCLTHTMDSVWKKLTPEEKQEIEQICNEKLEQYYRRLEKHSLRE